MYAVVRQYSAAASLDDTIKEKRKNLEESMKGIPGFVAYYLISSGTAVTTVTICQDRAGTDESVKRAADWVKQNLPTDIGLSAPQIMQGEVLVSAV